MFARPAPIRVLIVDDHRSVLWGLARLIESARPRLELVGSATCASEALTAAQLHPPDIVLLDIDLGGESGIDLIAELQSQASVIILSGVTDMKTRQLAVRAGARGLIHKSEPAEVILKAIDQVHAGERWIDRATLAWLLDEMSPGPRAGQAKGRASSELTSAERKVIDAVLRHKSAPNKVIAKSLGLSSHTLRNHLSTIYGKLGVHRRLDLVLHAMERGPSRFIV